ncbi:MAG: M60 family metallopeptidase [Bacteroidales bacterium]
MKKRFLYALLLISAVSLFSCTKSGMEEEEDDKKVPKLEISSERVEFDRISSSQEIDVSTNQDSVACKSNAAWCSASYNNGKISISVITNSQTTTRTGSINVKAASISRSITVSQKGLDSYNDDIAEDVKIAISSASTSSAQPSAGIELSYDGNYGTNYHSKWANGASDYFPIDLVYNFTDCPSMNYLVYYPRNSGSNGNIKEFELWVSTKDKPTMTKYGDYDFEGSSSTSIISFSPALVNPTSIKFVVKSGDGDGQGFVSCAEMEFYQSNPENFDYLTVFTDNSCSELKAGVNQSDIDAIQSELFKDLATEIFNEKYDKEFRVQSYKPWEDPKIMASVNKTSPYSLRDNPTGIFVSTGEKLIFFAENPKNERASIIIQDLHKGFGGSTYPVTNGVNSIDVSAGGLIYVMYHTNTATESAVKINFVTGTVNGYFDSQKHKKEDWKRILDNATYKHFDVLGKYAHMTFPTEDFRTNTPDGLALVNKYDEMVRMEMEFMGLFKYDKVFKNRMYFHVFYTDGHMYATSYRTAYADYTIDGIVSLGEFTSSPWGPAHEVGHCNQTRPGMKWAGMTEVTNNILSLHVETSWGNTSRLTREKRYSAAVADIVEGKIPHNDADNVFNKLVPFWQLKLYLMDVLGKKEFYKEMYEHTRNHDDSGTDQGEHQLNFVKTACQIANLDLTEFFEQWGFLYPIDREVDDYSKKWFKITQEQIDAVKAEIAAKNYPKPKHHDIYKITDGNVSTYK